MGIFGIGFLGTEDNENINSISKMYNIPYEQAKEAYIKMLKGLGVEIKEQK